MTPEELAKYHTTPSLAQALVEALDLLKQCEAYVWNPAQFHPASEVVDRLRMLKTEGAERELWMRITDFIKENGGYDR